MYWWQNSRLDQSSCSVCNNWCLFLFQREASLALDVGYCLYILSHSFWAKIGQTVLEITILTEADFRSISGYYNTLDRNISGPSMSDNINQMTNNNGFYLVLINQCLFHHYNNHNYLALLIYLSYNSNQTRPRQTRHFHTKYCDKKIKRYFFAKIF